MSAINISTDWFQLTRSSIKTSNIELIDHVNSSIWPSRSRFVLAVLLLVSPRLLPLFKFDIHDGSLRVTPRASLSRRLTFRTGGKDIESIGRVVVHILANLVLLILRKLSTVSRGLAPGVIAGLWTWKWFLGALGSVRSRVPLLYKSCETYEWVRVHRGR